MNTTLPSNPDIVFEPTGHTYSYLGRELESVTNVISRLKPSFDSEAMSHKVAKKRGVKQCDILLEWEATKNNACEQGKRLHAAVEAFLTGNEPDTSLAHFQKWHKWWSGIMQPVAIEHIIADLELGIAGMTDLVGWSPKTNLHHVMDCKTNKEFTCSNKWGDQLLPPFSDLAHCDLEGYSLQVSLYRLMLDRQGLETGDSWICHISPEMCRPYRAKDYRARLLIWLQGRM